jgi:two-component system, OmpR family, sensor kinase
MSRRAARTPRGTGGPKCYGLWPKPRSLRARFTIANVAFLAAGLILAAAASIAATYMVLISQMDDSLKSSQHSLQETSRNAGSLEQLCALARALENEQGPALSAAFQQDLFIVLDAQGRPAPVCKDSTVPGIGTGIGPEQRRLAAAIPDPARLARSGDAVTVKSGSQKYRVVAIALPDGPVMVKGMRLSGVHHALGKLLIVESCVGVVLLALLATGSLTAARRRLSPLEAMVQTASAISEGDLSRRMIRTTRHGSTEVEQLSAALNAMLQQIETALTESERATAQLRQFLADASHELRTPLASVRGYLQLYEKGMLDADEQDRALSRVSAEAVRMSRLVDELLALARLDDRPVLTFRPVDLCCLVRDAAADLAAQQPGRPLTLLLPPARAAAVDGGGAEDGGGAGDGGGAEDGAAVDGRPVDGRARGAADGAARNLPQGVSHGTPDGAPDPVLPVLGDEAGLRQVVGNLLSNVRVHTPADSPLTVTVTPDGDSHLLLRIIDTGPGLVPEDAARAFDRFFRAAPDRARDTGGAGLGMSIVQAVVHAHHGTVTLHTAPGKGLTVRVRLPVTESARPGVRVLKVPPAPAQSA